MKPLSSIEKSAKKLNAYILSLEVIKEYQKYETLIHQDKELSTLEIKMKALQKKIVNQKTQQDESVLKTIEEYQKSKEYFENHPLVVNYLYLKEEVNYLLQDINALINNQLLNKDLTKH